VIRAEQSCHRSPRLAIRQHPPRVNHAMTPSDLVATWSMIAREPFEIAGHNGDQLLRGLPQNTSRKLLRLYTDRLRFFPV